MEKRERIKIKKQTNQLNYKYNLLEEQSNSNKNKLYCYLKYYLDTFQWELKPHKKGNIKNGQKYCFYI